MTISVHHKNDSIKGTLQVPGDKSMSHRAVIFGSLAEGETQIENFLLGKDCLRTIEAFRKMGVKIEQHGESVTIQGRGVSGLQEPTEPLFFGNSGTTARLLLGVLSGLPYHFVLTGDDSLSNRPMDRVSVPLRQMGSTIDGRDTGRFLPMSIRGGVLQPIEYKLPVNSAQVKSAILLAGLLTEGTTTVVEPVATRDHTERMIGAFGGTITKNGVNVSIEGPQALKGAAVKVPGDISSAAFFIVAATLVEQSELVIENVGLNETRTGIIDLLKQMGANIHMDVTHYVGDEPVGTVSVKASKLTATTVEGAMIPRLVDEIPLIALAATQAEGKTVIKDAEELRVKETDRVRAIKQVLDVLGATVTEREDGLEIEGGTALQGGTVSSFGDHRIGMMAVIASFLSSEKIEIQNPDCIDISYPTFFEDVKKVIS
ncbi:3-phosphoshikimate 1-carboxyvinyltransferase [Salirhabdus salicampi]|uniref:3-phosphoshikimate 1-carboxyvinyltransferase n=1 Tax=Salirhabdus salicampi TaxID=476102 RepID=UPI0020C57945|nr:3-phosphoshikimate 1-carboxyvinyltransferase [Salirhabdus salicampi]MCP8616694.1 3-phosphoshikimate 1-carboxyvinyltransferase [Salirhabdus salicampi]